MRLFEHPDFEQALLRAARHHGVNEQFVEKDYYVTEILRIVAETLGGQAIFKGGTSLSKGWHLIERFSEDIDLFVDPQRFNPRPGTNKMDAILKRLAQSVAEHPMLTWERDEGKPINGRGRQDYFSYPSRFAALAGMRAAVCLEPGVQSGDFPTEMVPISSLVGQFLTETGNGSLAEDLDAFEMTLLHYRRTFVEKLFAMHSKVLRLEEDGHPLGRDARHYADLYVLAGDSKVQAMLRSPEYAKIRADYDRVSSRFFPEGHRPPDGLSFKDSPALFPSAELAEQLALAYKTQCQLLFPGNAQPAPFRDVLARFAEIRDLL